MGFLLFNVYPAKIFMGDTGSLALGGFVAGTAYMLQMPLFILIIGFIYLLKSHLSLYRLRILKFPEERESLRWHRSIIILNCADGLRQELWQFSPLSQQSCV